MMLCTNCSKPVRPVVAVDIDGTLGDYHSHFLRFLENYLGTRVGSRGYDGRERFSEWTCRLYGIDLTTFRQIKLAYRQGGMKRTMPIIAGALRLAQGLKEQDVELWMTTTRPHDRFDRVDPDTREWLRRHGIPFDGLIYSEEKYHELADRIEPERVAAVLDDESYQIYVANRLFPGRCIQRRTSWNRNDRPTRLMVEDLGAAAHMLKAHVDDWRIKHSFDALPTTTKD